MGIESSVLGNVAGAVAGPLIGGLMGGSDGGQSGTTTSSATNEPWKAIQPYLLGGGSISLPDGTNIDAKGLTAEAARLYGTTAMSQAQKDALMQQQGMNADLLNDNSLYRATLGNAQKANNGGFDTNLTQAGSISPTFSNLQTARASQGAVDPTQSLQKLLSGNPDNPYLQQQANALTALSNQNLMQNIMPQIGSAATVAGQYGGSRQGIAQGVAAGNAQTGLNNAIAGLYGNAYTQAQNNMYGTANALNQQAGQNAQFNSSLDFNAQNANANIQLQNNEQQMAQAQQNLSNRLAGAQLTNLGLAGQNSLFGQNNAIYDTLRNDPWSELAKYQSVIQPVAGMGNSASQTNPYFTNTAGNVLGGALAGQQLFKGMGSGSLFGGSPGGNGWDGYTGFSYGDYL